MIKLINLTPHPINLRGVELRSEGIARVEMAEDVVSILRYGVRSVPVVRQRAGEVTGLPEPQEGIGYVVSRLVAEALPERTDLFYPAHLERDENGRVVGCAALGRVS